MNRKSFVDYEVLEEELRHICVKGLEDQGLPRVPMLEAHVTNTVPKGGYGVLSLVSSEPFGLPTQERRMVDDGQAILLTECQEFTMMFGIELLGKQSRTHAFQLALWCNSRQGFAEFHRTGFAFYRTSSIRALHDLVQSGDEWERRSQFDLEVSCVMRQKQSKRERAQPLTSASVRTWAPNNLRSTFDAP